MARSTTTRRSVAIALGLAVLTACGASGDSAGNAAASDVVQLPVVTDETFIAGASTMIADGATATRQAVRVRVPGAASPPFTGRMIGKFESSFVGLDLASGRYSTLAGSPALVELGAGERFSFTDARPDRAVTSGAVLTVDDCSRTIDDVVCVVFVDRNGNFGPDDFFALRADGPGPAKTSFDGQYVIMELTDRASAASVISVRRRDGTFVTSYEQSAGAGGRGHYDFLADGRVIYGTEGNELLGDNQPTGFVIADPSGQVSPKRYTMPAFYQGTLAYLRTIDTSPDGSQALMTMKPSIGPTRPILLDLEDLSITQVIERDDGTSSDVVHVTWGPGGSWIYATIPRAVRVDGVFRGTVYSLYAFEANGETHPLPVDGSNLGDSVRLIPTESIYDRGGPVGPNTFRGELVWVP